MGSWTQELGEITLDRIEQLDAIVSQFDLNTHPFYNDWRMGTLPVERLSLYAREYGAFVATVADGWETVNEKGYAAEERYHEELWQDFRAELNSGCESSLGETAVLVNAAKLNFAGASTAAGALYAFEAQQPKTTQTKLDGLMEHYPMSEKGREYFRVHADDFAEAENLRGKIREMSDAEFARTKSACTVVCSALWAALDGVYYS